MARRKRLIFIIFTFAIFAFCFLRRLLGTTFPINKQLLIPPELAKGDVERKQNQSIIWLTPQRTATTTKMESTTFWRSNHRRRRRHIKNPIIIPCHQINTTIHVCRRTKIICKKVCNCTRKTTKRCRCYQTRLPCIWKKRPPTICPLTCGYVTTEDTECVPSGPLYIEQRTDVDWHSLCCGDRTTENTVCATHVSKFLHKSTTCCKPKTEDMICATIRTRPINELLTTKCCHTFNLTSVSMTWPISERSIRPDPFEPHPPIWWQKHWPWPPHSGNRPPDYPFPDWPPKVWPPWSGLTEPSIDPAKPTPPRPPYWPANLPWPPIFPPGELFPQVLPFEPSYNMTGLKDRWPPLRPSFYPAHLPWPPKIVFPPTLGLFPYMFHNVSGKNTGGQPLPSQNLFRSGGMFLRVIPTNTQLNDFLKRQRNINKTTFRSKLKHFLDKSFIKRFMKAFIINYTQQTSLEETPKLRTIDLQRKPIQNSTKVTEKSQKMSLKSLLKTLKATFGPHTDQNIVVPPPDNKVPAPLTLIDKIAGLFRNYNIHPNEHHPLLVNINQVLKKRYKYSKHSTKQTAQINSTLLTSPRAPTTAEPESKTSQKTTKTVETSQTTSITTKTVETSQTTSITTKTVETSEKTTITTLKTLLKTLETTSEPHTDGKSVTSSRPTTLTEKPLTLIDKINGFIRKHNINPHEHYPLLAKVNEMLKKRFRDSKYSTQQTKHTARTLNSQVLKNIFRNNKYPSFI